MAFMSRDR